MVIEKVKGEMAYGEEPIQAPIDNTNPPIRRVMFRVKKPGRSELVTESITVIKQNKDGTFIGLYNEDRKSRYRVTFTAEYRKEGENQIIIPPPDPEFEQEKKEEYEWETMKTGAKLNEFSMILLTTLILYFVLR